MTRYELAAMAMQALITREKYVLVLDHNGVRHIAEKACAIADIMLQEFSAPIVPKEPIGTKPIKTVPPKPSKARIRRLPWSEKQLSELVEMAADGYSDQQLADHFKRSKSAIANAIHKIRHQLQIGPINRGNKA